MRYELENQRHKMSASIVISADAGGFIWRASLTVSGSSGSHGSRRIYKHKEVAVSDALVALSQSPAVTATDHMSTEQKQILELWSKQTFRHVWAGVDAELRRQMIADEFTNAPNRKR